MCTTCRNTCTDAHLFMLMSSSVVLWLRMVKSSQMRRVVKNTFQ